MNGSNSSILALPFQIFESNGLRSFRLTLYGVITLASFLGNLAVIKSISAIPYRKPLTYHMVTSLAIAELVSTLTLPFIQVYDEKNTWTFGKFMCQLTNPTQMSSCLVVTWTLAIISIHRYRTLVTLNRGPLYVKNIGLLNAAMWMAAIITTFPSFIFSTLVKSPYDNHSYWCVVLFPGDTLSTFPSPIYKRYLLVRFVVNFLVPMLIMVLSYGAIGYKLKYHMAMIQSNAANIDLQITPPTACTSLNESNAPNDSNLATSHHTANPAVIETKISDHNEGQTSMAKGTFSGQPRAGSQDAETLSSSTNTSLLIEHEHDLLKMIYAIVLIFILFYFPYQVFFFIEYYGYISYGKWQYHHITRKYIFLVTCLPSALHPLCYGTMSKFYAKAFYNIILCKWSKQANQSV